MAIGLVEESRPICWMREDRLDPLRNLLFQKAPLSYEICDCGIVEEAIGLKTLELCWHPVSGFVNSQDI
jgi:hypothetical protein